MKIELDDRLCRAFPLLYRSAPTSETLMCFGFEMGDGWFAPLFLYSQRLEALIAAQPEGDRAYADQAKQKLGGIRLYLDGAVTPVMDALVEELEAVCWRTCEGCGAPGKPQTLRGWIRTECDACHAERVRR